MENSIEVHFKKPKKRTVIQPYHSLVYEHEGNKVRIHKRSCTPIFTASVSPIAKLKDQLGAYQELINGFF
jgi:hypothetical protein